MVSLKSRGRVLSCRTSGRRRCSHYFTTSFARRRATPDAGWEDAARARVEVLVSDYTPLAPMAVDLSALPAAARARYDASHAVLEVPTIYRIEVSGRPFYLVLVTDGSGEGTIVVVDLVDGSGRWFAHGIGHAFWDGSPGFAWTLDLSDPTMCVCGAAGQPSTCTWMDGTTSSSTELTCE